MYSLKVPAVVTRPILPFPLPWASTNHRAPSGPVVMACESLPGVGIGYSVMDPATVMRQTLLPKYSVNHSAPSGPVVIPYGSLSGVGMAYWLNDPSTVTRPMLLPRYSVNQRAPSGPTAMPRGWLPGVGTEYAVVALNVPDCASAGSVAMSATPNTINRAILFIGAIPQV